MESRVRLVFWLSQHSRYSDFRVAEYKGLVSLAVNELRAVLPETDTLVEVVGQKFFLLNLLGPVGLTLLREWVDVVLHRTVLIRMVGIVYEEGQTIKEIVEQTQKRNVVQNTDNPYLSEGGFTRTKVAKLLFGGKTFAWYCEVSGKSYTLEEKVCYMNTFSNLFDQKIHRADLKRPDEQFFIVEEISVKICVGLVLGAIVGCSKLVSRLALNHRPVLGPTTLDTELSFLMCNMAGVREDSLVYDPFCGTGSILLSATALGAHCIGSDFDLRVLRGWGVAKINQAYQTSKYDSTSIYTNFDHYSFHRPDVARCNIYANCIIDNCVDCVITDPPYGIRAMTKCADSFLGMFRKLVAVSARILKPGGLLVFLIPCTEQFQVDAELLEKLAEPYLSVTLPVCFQDLAGKKTRLCVAMQKKINSETYLQDISSV